MNDRQRIAIYQSIIPKYKDALRRFKHTTKEMMSTIRYLESKNIKQEERIKYLIGSLEAEKRNKESFRLQYEQLKEQSEERQF